MTCPHCGYTFFEESKDPTPRTYHSCPRCGCILSVPYKIGSTDESTPGKEGLPYKTIVEEN